MMDRRSFLTSSTLAITGASVAAWLANPIIESASAKTAEEEDSVTVIGFDDTGKKLGPTHYSVRKPNLIRGRAGPVSGRPSRRRIFAPATT